ncbi:hypothetical protein DSO57_1017846 [Entomophthora muscae]|uniref:Uncharacterized protein n=1 Tax=Entomophthora muscae TaxID=34485 RepID=A0ACC2U2U3_9FUNG|nr:hypothetical protein DSO57_1017846 [Entomophthora muscae]
MHDFQQISGLVLGCLGLISNGLLLVVLCRTKIGWHRLNLQMVGPLAVLDFTASLLVVLKNVMYFAYGNMLSGVGLCAYLGTSLIVLPYVSIVLVAVMAVDRHQIVVYGSGVRCKWGWAFVGLVAVLLSTINILNTAIYGIHPASTFALCRFVINTTVYKIAFYLSSLILVTALVTVNFCYVGIYLHCRKVFASFHTTMSARSLFMLVTYHFCWLPNFSTIIWNIFHIQSAKPSFLTYAAQLSVYLYLFVNPCLVLAFQSSLRNQLYSLLKGSSLSTNDLPTLLSASESNSFYSK